MTQAVGSSKWNFIERSRFLHYRFSHLCHSSIKINENSTNLLLIN